MTTDDGGQQYRVRLGARDQGFGVRRGETVLEAAHRAGHDLPHACRGGRCGLCAARLVAGRTQYPEGEPAAVGLRAVPDDHVLLCRAYAESDLELDIRPIRAAASAGPRRLPARIAAVELLAADLKRVSLRLPRTEPLPFRAGQYLDVIAADGGRRSYSIASPPLPDALIELHIRRGTSGGTGASLYDAMQPGGLVEIEGPFGEFVFDPAATDRPLVLVAGGTGFAPVRAILSAALAHGGSRPVVLYRGARTHDELYDHERLLTDVGSEGRLRYVPVLSEESAVAAPIRSGLVHEVVLDDLGEGASAVEVYAAGPPPMLRALRAGLYQRGLPPPQFHSDLPDD